MDNVYTKESLQKGVDVYRANMSLIIDAVRTSTIGTPPGEPEKYNLVESQFLKNYIYAIEVKDGQVSLQVSSRSNRGWVTLQEFCEQVVTDSDMFNFKVDGSKDDVAVKSSTDKAQKILFLLKSELYDSFGLSAGQNSANNDLGPRLDEQRQCIADNMKLADERGIKLNEGKPSYVVTDLYMMKAERALRLELNYPEPSDQQARRFTPPPGTPSYTQDVKSSALVINGKVNAEVKAELLQEVKDMKGRLPKNLSDDDRMNAESALDGIRIQIESASKALTEGKPLQKNLTAIGGIRDGLVDVDNPEVRNSIERMCNKVARTASASINVQGIVLPKTAPMPPEDLGNRSPSGSGQESKPNQVG